jgi:hypothetical protein
VALVRVYCGLASAETQVATEPPVDWLTAAVVDDAGRLLDVFDISDDPAGFARLGELLAERSAGTAGVAVAVDTDEHTVALLLAAAGRPLAIADEDSLEEYTDRFGDDESAEEQAAPRWERRAIGLARALQAGAMAAHTVGAPRELMALKPVLAAHAAVATGRQGAAVALREVLRELYPAALRAYPDPAERLPLAILDALPEPGLLSPGSANRGRDTAIIAELADAGVADIETISEAIAALRVAISETPRRTGIGKTLTTAVAETIRQAVAAVRACDTAAAALVDLLTEKAAPVPSAFQPAGGGGRANGTPAGGLTTRSGPERSEPSRIPTPVPLRAVTKPAADAGRGQGSRRGRGGGPDPLGLAEDFPGSPPEQQSARPAPGFTAPGSRSDWPVSATDTGSQPVAVDRNGLRLVDPTAAPPGYDPYAEASYGSGGPRSLERYPTGAYPATPRQAAPADPYGRPVQGHGGYPAVSYPSSPLRLVDGERTDTSLSAEQAEDQDGDLLIFAQIRSAWFNGPATGELEINWDSPGDSGWQQAARASQPNYRDSTGVGLPRRVPQANLVPGSPGPTDRPLRIVRDAAALAAHTTGYFRGLRRGEEVRGFAVGGRPGREPETGWDFSRDAWEGDVDRGHEYRSAARR